MIAAPGRGYEKTPVMIFCGAGSIPFVSELERRYDDVEVNIQEGVYVCVYVCM